MKGILVAFTLMGFIHQVFACECEGDFARVKEKFRRSRVVFVGKVMGIERLEAEANVEFQVLRSYKGSTSEKLVLSTVAVGSMAAVCGYEFQVGEEYLVYAYGAGNKADDIYMSEGCPSVKKLDCSDEDLAYLEKQDSIWTKDMDTVQVHLNNGWRPPFQSQEDFDFSRCDGCYGITQ